MAEGVVKFVLEKLGDAFVKEVLHLNGVSKQVEKLTRELRWIQDFLKDADRKRIVDERQKRWVKEVRDVAYDIEDVIDTILSEMTEEKPGIMEAGKRLWTGTKKIPNVHRLANEINKIEERIKEIEASRVRYGINNLGEGIDGEIGQPVKRIVLPDIDEEGIVGFEADRDKVLSLLLDEKTTRRSVISIVGQGGLGKTTLARKVYNSEAVKQQFPIRIWVVVSQNFNSIDILGKIAVKLEIEPPRDLNDYDRLTELRRSLTEKKYLILLDDIWEENFWDKIKEVFPDEKNGSRILITTRKIEVVPKADHRNVYELPVLNEELSLKLFFKKALPDSDTNETIPDDLYGIGEQLTRKCGGLPLALRVLGGLLSTKPAASWRTEMEKWDWGKDGEECSAIISTSYDDLPFALKSCFMYFAAFPEDDEIEAMPLLWLWVAEGFIPQQENKTLEDTAEMFLEHLVQRSMIQVSVRDYDGSIIVCRIHDLLHDLAIRKAREENFLVVFPKIDGVRRLVIHDEDPSNELMASPISNLRTLWCHGQPPNVSQFTRLKVLSSSESADYEPDKFGRLSLLRYLEVSLKVREEDKDYFGKFIGGMRFLQTLNLQESDDCDLPDFVWNIKTLRHVLLAGNSFGPPPSIDLPNLQTLSGVKARESWVAQGSPKLPNVKHLWMYVPEAQGGVQWDAIVTLLNTMKYLVILSLEGPNIPLKIINMRHFLFRRCLIDLFLYETRDDEDEEQRAQPDSPQPLNQIVLDVDMLPKYLIKLLLYNINFLKDLFPVVEKLENLRYLHLIGPKLPLRLCCSAGGFGKLEELALEKLEGLEEWEIEEGAMPMLKNLRVDCCRKLRVPLGLQYLTVLQKLNWWYNETSETKKNEIRSICKHVPVVYIR
ncbi:hypothetical protein LUZ61_012093 [Rhynchospora tenuis]|uniref:Uncharacterized protein n=1 Tax=Rhynchospora tenuis TaxID=198213 RepID=A0AAD6F164_9POAL|nr:hypothetical protein LUZ61_012093 [Rhynchospora tenuis]